MLGAARVAKAGNFSASGDVVVSWDSAPLDTSGAWSPLAPTVLTAPFGCRAAVFALSALATTDKSDVATWSVLRDGSEVTRLRDGTNEWGAPVGGGGCVVPVTAGQTISLQVSVGSRTYFDSRLHFGVQWLA